MANKPYRLDGCKSTYGRKLVGTHRRIAKKLGAKRGSVPFLRTGDSVVAVSSVIIDWCESQPTANAASLAGDDVERVRSIEPRLSIGNLIASVTVQGRHCSHFLRCVALDATKYIATKSISTWAIDQFYL